MRREIKGLRWARECGRPSCIPIGRPRGAKAQGLRYERGLALTLAPAFRHGQWFEYEDGIGRGYCQVDFLRVDADRVIALEAKYTWTIEGHWQLERLYIPIVERVYARPAVGVVVCKNLSDGVMNVHGLLEDAITSGRPRSVWQALPMAGAKPRMRPLCHSHELGFA